MEDIYTAIAVTLQQEGILQAPLEQREDLVRQLLTKHRVLLIVDNLETVDDERVMAFIREIPTPTKIIVTTRHRLDIAYPVRLMGLSRDEALRLIDDECQKRDVTITSKQSDHLYQRTGGVPLAII